MASSQRPKPPPASGAAVAIYNVLVALGLVAALPWLLFRVATSERYRRGLLERLSVRLPPARGAAPRVWVHAASAGEMVAATALVRELEARREGIDVLVSSATTSGVDVARRLIPERFAFLLPLDLWPGVGRVLDRVDPDVLVLVELELWPTLVRRASARGARIVVANGRIGRRTCDRLKWPLARALLGLDAVSAFLVQSEENRKRLRSLLVGDERIVVTGNMKADATAPDPEIRPELRRRLGADERDFVLVAGSTHPGEEAALARAVRATRALPGGAILVVAPRHRERLADAERDLSREGLRARRWSALRPGADPVAPEDAVVVDTMGDLASLYRAADAAFVGGSLFPGVGGHNVFEPVLAGAPTLIGPHHKNVRSDVLYLREREAIFVLPGPEALAPALAEVRSGRGAEMRRRAARAVDEARGAAKRTVDVILSRCLSAASPGSDPDPEDSA